MPISRSWPVDALASDVISALEQLGFELVRSGNHIQLARTGPDGKRTPMTLPGQRRIKGSTLRRACTEAGITRDEFLAAFYRD